MRRPHPTVQALSSLILAVAIAGCGGSETSGDAAADASTGSADCLNAATRDVIDRFGRSLRHVSLLAPDSLLDASLRENYGELVTPALLERWSGDPALAPGRLTSSPWPDRIEVSSAAGTGNACVVHGELVYATSTDTAGGEALRENVTIRLQNRDGWRISEFALENGTSRSGNAAEPGARTGAGADSGTSSAGEGSAEETTPEAAADVIRRYYAAIAAGEYARAYRLWSDDGAASGQTLEGFRRGYAETSTVQADVGAATDLEGAAGSIYVKVPVVVRAVTRKGERQHFEGTYTLRRSSVDGATAEQRAWRIYDATVSAAPADTDERDA